MGHKKSCPGVNSNENAFFQINSILSLLVISILLLSSILLFIPLSDNARAEPSAEPEIEYLAIDVDIDNNYATADIHQLFRNPYNYSIDDTFKFQIPDVE